MALFIHCWYFPFHNFFPTWNPVTWIECPDKIPKTLIFDHRERLQVLCRLKAVEISAHLYRERSAAIIAPFQIGQFTTHGPAEVLAERSSPLDCVDFGPFAHRGLPGPASKLWGRGAKICHVSWSRMHRLKSGERCSRAYRLRGYSQNLRASGT